MRVESTEDWRAMLLMLHEQGWEILAESRLTGVVTLQAKGTR